MQLPTQEQFVKDCLVKYWFANMPSDQKWEDAHFPLPACLGEHDTVQLWSADHTVQGLLQSVELDHKCFHYGANSKDLHNLQTYYPQYLPLFQQLKSQFSSRQAQKTVELGVGLHGMTPQQRTINGIKGGQKSLGGVSNARNKTGCCGQSAEKMAANGKKTSSQRYQCLVTSHISTPAGLSNYQKKRGIDTKLRVRRLDLEG